MKATAIILAAGESRRMGVPKALLDAGEGLTFLGRLVKVFDEARLVPLVVLGAHAAQLQSAHREVPAVVNRRWQDGQLSSVFVGLRAALAQGAQRILIQPVDMPLISASTAALVLADLENAPVVVPTYEGMKGHPLGLTSAAALRLLGSRVNTLEEAAVLFGAEQVQVDDSHILDNLNTPEAYQQRFGRRPDGL